MKAILILDEMPKNCWGCPLHRSSFDDDNEEIMICRGTYRESFYGKRPNWCPLKPMPSREDIHEEIYQAYGLGKEEPYIRMRDAVDKVLDEILGEE